MPLFIFSGPALHARVRYMNVFLLEKWQYVTKCSVPFFGLKFRSLFYAHPISASPHGFQESISLMIVDRSFYNRVSLLNSARVYCVSAFQKDGLGQDQGRWVFASFCKHDFLQICLTAELRLVSRGASSGLEIWNQLTLPRKSSKQPRINADWTLN